MKEQTLSFIEQTFDIWNLAISEKGFRWLDPQNFKLDCSKTFVNLFNQLQLVFNYHTNLHLKEDLSYEDGMSTYGIDIPLIYFRFPSLNDPRNSSYMQLQNDEEKMLEQIKEESKKKLNYRNDGSIVEEMDSRFEFLTLYSSFEAFCEELLIEKNKNEKNATKKYGDLVRSNNLLYILQSVFEQYDQSLYDKIKSNFPIFDSLVMFFYRSRNLYTHKNGFVTQYFINQGLTEPKFLKHYYFDIEKQKELYLINCFPGELTVYEGKNLNCQITNAHFRAFSTTIVELLNLEE